MILFIELFNFDRIKLEKFISYISNKKDLDENIKKVYL